jgi:hypothetical protein
MGLFDGIPTRSNGEDILAAWFNSIKTTLNTVFDAFTLNDLTDVDITAPSNGDVIIYNSISGNFENGPQSGGGGGLGQLENIAFIGKGTAKWSFVAPVGDITVQDQLDFSGEVGLSYFVQKGFTFTPSNTGELKLIVGKLVNRGLATASLGMNVKIKVYATDGSGLPTGAVLDTSTGLGTAAIGVNNVVTNNYIFNGNVQLTAGVKYAAMYESSDTGTVNLFRGAVDETYTENVEETGFITGIYQQSAEQRSLYHNVVFDNIASGGELILSDDCYISVPNLLQNRHKIQAGTYNFNNDQALWLTVNRAAPAEAYVTVNSDFITNISPDGNKLIFAQSVGGECHIGMTDPQRIAAGETTELNKTDDYLVPVGTSGTPITVDETLGIIVGTNSRQIIFVESNGGEKTVSANPQISVGTKIGQELVLVGTSDTDSIILNDGTGLELNGALKLNNKQSASFFWNGTSWQEISRR